MILIKTLLLMMVRMMTVPMMMLRMILREGDVENCEAQDHDLERDELQYDDVKDGGSAEVEGNVSGLLWQDRCSGAWLSALCRMWKRATK